MHIRISKSKNKDEKDVLNFDMHVSLVRDKASLKHEIVNYVYVQKQLKDVSTFQYFGIFLLSNLNHVLLFGLCVASLSYFFTSIVTVPACSRGANGKAVGTFLGLGVNFIFIILIFQKNTILYISIIICDFQYPLSYGHI